MAAVGVDAMTDDQTAKASMEHSVTLVPIADLEALRGVVVSWDNMEGSSLSVTSDTIAAMSRLIAHIPPPTWAPDPDDVALVRHALAGISKWQFDIHAAEDFLRHLHDEAKCITDE